MAAALCPSWKWGGLDLTSEPFLFGRDADAFDAGAPVTATEALAQLLTDGEVEVGLRASNRTLEFTVYVEGADLLAAAESEALLAAEADRPRNTLTFDPGDGFAPPTVYETFRAQLTFVRDEAAERDGLRRYDVTMQALPHGRSVGLVETPAIGQVSVPTVAVINAGTDLPGWTAGASGTVTDIGTRLKFTRTSTAGVGSSVDFTYTASSPISFASLGLVGLNMRSASPGDLTVIPSLRIDGALATFVGSASGFYYWDSPASSGLTFRFGDSSYTPGVDISFNALRQTDSLPNSSTTRQKQRTIAVSGSARTQGSLLVQHDTSSLGSTLVYTWPATQALDYAPPLRSRRTAGGAATSDAGLVSGARDLLDTTVVFDIPVSSLIKGTHLLMARVRSDTNGDQGINYSAQTLLGSTDLVTPTTGSAVVPFGTTPTAWRNVVLARLTLPLTAVPPNSSAVVRIAINAAPAASNIDLDEAWLFNTSVGDLTWVECGTGTAAAGGPANRLWLDTATTEEPRPGIFKGFSADRSDAFHPGPDVISFGDHKFSPPLMNVFTVTSNALDAAVSLEHYPRWHTHAAS